MAAITTRAGKGSALTHAEVDANFVGLNNALETIMVTPLLTLTNQALAEAELATLNGYSTILLPTLGRYSQMRLTCRVATSSASINTPEIYPQYSVDAVNWITIGSASGSEAILLSTTGQKATSWITLPAGALGADVYFRIAQAGGDGVADPAIRGVCYQFAA